MKTRYLFTGVLLLLLVALGCVAIVYAETAQERYTYQTKVVGGETRCVERYETRETDLDSTAQVTTQRRDTIIDKAEKVAQLSAEKALLVAQANAIQTRINNLNAAGCP